MKSEIYSAYVSHENGGYYGISSVGTPTSFIKGLDPLIQKPFYLRSLFVKEYGLQISFPNIPQDTLIEYSIDPRTGLGRVWFHNASIANTDQNTVYEKNIVVLLLKSDKNLFGYFFFDKTKELINFTFEER